MNKFLMAFCTIILCGIIIAAPACTQNEIDVLGTGTQCETAKFSITTTNLTANTTFKFAMSAMGTFYVDWGDGTVDTITRDNTTPSLYDHKYTTAGTKAIRFGGLATGYSTEQKIAAISFGYYLYENVGMSNSTPQFVKSINGSLGAIFPTLTQSESGTLKYPKFISTFEQTGIDSIPENLFSGVSGGVYKMFDSTFYGTQITSIPENLFAGITGRGNGDVFFQTFKNCFKLTSIPSGLFKDVTSLTGYGFYGTFYGCTSLTSIPENLFGKVRTAQSNLFTFTFYGCTRLKGYIPASTFAGLIANGSPTFSGMWNNTFYNTKLAISCPAGTVQYITGYEGTDTTNYTKWNGKVSCVDENLVCGAGEHLPAHWFKCEPCPADSYCPGGTYPYSEAISSGVNQCPAGLFAPTGMWEVAQCGRILHVGDGFVYLRATKKTSPSLHLDLDHDGVADYFGNMTTMDVPMSRDTQRKLKVRYNNTTYSIYDDSVELPSE